MFMPAAAFCNQDTAVILEQQPKWQQRMDMRPKKPGDGTDPGLVRIGTADIVGAGTGAGNRAGTDQSAAEI